MKKIFLIISLCIWTHYVNAQNMSARFWLESEKITKMAEEGNAEAQYAVGYDYYIGLVNKQDYETALEWFRKSADRNYPEAFVWLGICYYSGKGVDKNIAEALTWWRKGAEKNFGACEYLLGICYMSGDGVTKDQNEGFKWYKKAAEHGYAKAQSKMGYYCRNGLYVEKNDEEAISWYQKAAAQDDPDGLEFMGFRYLERDKNEDAVKCFSKAAKAEKAKSLYVMGRFYYDGLYGVEQNHQKAFSMFMSALNRGVKESKTYLGMMYYYGQGTEKDTNKAFQTLSEAVKDKSVLSAKAMRVLSACYRYGLGTEKNAKEEQYWLEQAAKYDDKNAKNILGIE